MYRILIVEDDLGIAEGIKRQMEAWDLEAKCVEDFRNVTEEFDRYILRSRWYLFLPLPII